ncbi:MAG: cytochrome P450 [Steroidobacteraceae bacterium]
MYELKIPGPDLRVFVVTRYDDIRAICQDVETFGNAPNPKAWRWGDTDAEVAAIYRREGWPLDTILTFSDPPAHTRQRKLSERAFLPRRMETAAVHVQSVVDELIDAFAADGRVEFMSAFARKLPIRVITHQFGLPKENAEFALETTNAMAAMIDMSYPREVLLQGVHTVCKFQHLLAANIERLREHPEETLFSDLVNAKVEGEPTFGMQELLSICLLILGAGTESSGGVIAWAIYELACRPELADELRRSPEKVGAFTEELLRLHSSVPGSYRTVRKDAELHGVKMPQGSVVMIRWDGANLDPTQFENPMQLDIARSNRRQHATFGLGLHYCMGNLLARKEIELSVKTLLRRFDKIELGAPKEQIEPIAALNYHVLAELPLELRQPTRGLSNRSG